MRFKQIENYAKRSNSGEAEFVNKRLEYFHHYWTFVMEQNTRWIFFDQEKLESHRSLFAKIEIQLEHNKERYPKRIRELLVNHPYFNSSNLLLKHQKAALTQLAILKSGFPMADWDQGSIRLPKIKKDLSAIKRLILGTSTERYFIKILGLLIKSLTTDKRLSSDDKEAIQFLVNASIVELYYAGYSFEYIKKIPDVILFPRSYKEDFPFDKEYSHFNDDDAYHRYKETSLASLTLQKQLASLLNLINQPKRKGFFILRIDNFNFTDREPLKIWDATFYNPQISRKLNLEGMQRYKRDLENIERYFEQHLTEYKKRKLRSTCNVIVPTEYRPQYFNYVDPSIFKVIEKIEHSLSVLKHLKRMHVGGYSYSTSVNLTSVIVADQQMKYRAAPWVIHDYDDLKPFKIKAAAKEVVGDYLKWAHKLNEDQEFHKKIIDIYVAINRYRHNPFSFSFHDFWTSVAEPLFPNKYNQFIEFCCKCIELYLNDQYLTGAKIFLHDSLKSGGFSGGTYVLSKSKVKSLGMEIVIRRPIKARSFARQYLKINNHIEFEFLTDMIKEIDVYVNNRTVFMEKVKTRLRTLLNEAYAERNLEVHNNLSTDISLIKLRETCISVAVILRLIISQKITTRCKSVKDLKI